MQQEVAPVLLSILLVSAVTLSVAAASDGITLTRSSGHVSSTATTDAATRAQETLNGLLHYYWKSDPLHKQIKFLFACGQIGGWGKPRSESECSCDHPTSCVNCYRWWDAVALESVATYGIYANTKTNSDMADSIFAHSPYNGDWNATAVCTFIDDFAWYGIAYLRVYEWLNDTKWLNHSLALYDWIWTYGWDEPCGGFWWTNCDKQKFKDSITNAEVLHFSSKLAYLFPNEPLYLEQSERIWNWFFSFDNGYGLMSDKYLVSTGAVPEFCCNASTTNPYEKCHNSKLSGTSYNQGLLMSASAFLFLRTGNKSYLNVGLQAVEAILTNYTTKDGIIIDEPRSYQSYEGSCWAGADPGGDWYSFNGIFMLHLGYFTTLLHENGSLPSSILDKINSLVTMTSDSAWKKSAVWPPFNTTYDACDLDFEATGSNTTFPKFHWWWGHDVSQQIIPPSPKLFFHRRKLRCTGNNTQIWEGKTGSEDNCTVKCMDNALCSKYTYGAHNTVPGLDCWLWSYNRSDHSCHTIDDKFYIGVKRPVGNATCAGQCGSKTPQKLEHAVCFCDPDCAKHLDCCLDYANQCQNGQYNSCKGQCTQTIAQPIAGGGYCWCFDGCNGWFTDNNSEASCCPDYPPECMDVPMPVCLDARSQGSALNLFLTHMKLSKVK